MTDDEILRKAEAITARRKRAKRAREIMSASSVQIVSFNRGAGVRDRIDVPQDAELAAFLCRVMDCDITEGKE